MASISTAASFHDSSPEERTLDKPVAPGIRSCRGCLAGAGRHRSARSSASARRGQSPGAWRWLIFPRPGEALVTSSERKRRSKSVRRMEFRSVRMASPKLSDHLLRRVADGYQSGEALAPTKRARISFTMGKVPTTWACRVRATCSGSRKVLSSTSLRTAAPTASRVEKRNAKQNVQLQIRENRLHGGPRGVGDADGAVLEAGVDSRFLDFAHQFFVELLVGLGLAFQRLVLERSGVKAVKLGLGLRHGLPQHGSRLMRLTILDVHPLGDVLALACCTCRCNSAS